VTSTLAGPSSGDEMDTEPAAPVTAQPAGVLTGLDVLAGAAVLVVALLAWASLALAHVGHHSLPGVLALAAVGLLAVAAVLVRAARGRIAVRLDLPGMLLAVGCAAVAAALTFPAFSYGVADKDPGGYVSHAVEIAHHGDYGFTDPIVRDLPNQWQPTSPDAVFPGVWVRDAPTGRIVPQFYHLWPSLLATAYDVGGIGGLRFAVPLMGVLAVLCIVALLRRVGDAVAGPSAGLVAAGVGGVLLATNMLEVWQARYPTTEVFAEALYLGALLGVVVALQSRWAAAAGVAGLFVGIGWLNRPDGLLMVMLSVGVGAALIATRRWDARATWFAAGLAVVVPHALLQAYDLAHNYSIANSIPSLPKVAAVVVGCGVLALGLRLVAGRPLGRITDGLQDATWQVRIGFLVCAGALALLVVGFLRPRLFGVDYLAYNGRQIRSYDEQILRRLSWFFTLPGFALMGLGLAAVALRRWRAAAWAVVLPTLAFFVVYGYTARNSSRLLWWSRRYVPTVLPGVVMLIALAIATAWVVRVRGRALLRIPAALAAAALVAVFLSQSVPVRRHDEWKGSFALTKQIAGLSGDRHGIYLWEPQGEQGCCAGPTALFATPVWLVHDGLSALLPLDHARRTEILMAYAKHFPGRPLFVVGDDPQLPDGVDPASVEPVLVRHVELPMWDESDTARPAGSHQVPVDIAVWHVRGT
jgi:hypothetical protein